MDNQAKYDSTLDTTQHIKLVMDALANFCMELMHRAQVHDDSKLREPEKSGFDRAMSLKEIVYDSPEYKKSLEQLQETLKHHYAENSHHPQHYTNGIDGMSLLDVVEMYCDWQAAVHSTKDGSFEKSVAINTERFNMSPQLAKIFLNTDKIAPFYL